MKKLLYINLLFVVGWSICGCNPDSMETTLSEADSFVSFDTHSGDAYTLVAYENDTVIVKIDASTPSRTPLTVDFDVYIPALIAGTEAADYAVLDMNDRPIAASPYYRLTFPNGSGSQSFKFVPKGSGNVLEGDRTLSLQIKDNSAGYRIGFAKVDGSAGGANILVSVMDDLPIEIDDLVGTWEVTEDIFVGQWYDGEVYPITVEKISDDSVRVIGLGEDDEVVLIGTVFLGKGMNKYIELPAQDIAAEWDAGYIPRFATLNNTGNLYANVNDGFVGDYRLQLVKSSDGSISLEMTGATGRGRYSWIILALQSTDRSYGGYYLIGYGTKWVKRL